MNVDLFTAPALPMGWSLGAACLQQAAREPQASALNIL